MVSSYDSSTDHFLLLHFPTYIKAIKHSEAKESFIMLHLTLFFLHGVSMMKRFSQGLYLNSLIG